MFEKSCQVHWTGLQLCVARTASLRSLARSKSLLVFQMSSAQLRHFAKDHLSFVLPSEMLLHASRGCQVDDLKKALRLELVSLASLELSALPASSLL